MSTSPPEELDAAATLAADGREPTDAVVPADQHSSEGGSQVEPLDAKVEINPAVGFLFCVGSSVGYTLANIFLRIVTDVDPVWVASVKAAPTLLIALPWALSQRGGRRSILPPMGLMLALVVGSLLANYGGNVLFQWSLGVLGVAMAVSITLGAMIVSGAILGRVMLGERIHRAMAISCSVLLVGIAVLSLGAADANASVAAMEVNAVGLAFAAACFAGFAYSSMGAVMRFGLLRGVSVASTLLVLSGVGWAALTAWALWRIGLDGVAATSSAQWTWMVLAGVANALAFIALTKALQSTTMLMVNGVNASQAAMCGAAGVLIFSEALTWPLIIGIALTVVGLMLMRR